MQVNRSRGKELEDGSVGSGNSAEFHDWCVFHSRAPRHAEVLSLLGIWGLPRQVLWSKHVKVVEAREQGWRALLPLL
jgi:hypothetical protein